MGQHPSPAPLRNTPTASSTLETKGLPPRLLAWQVLHAVQAGAYADVALERQLARTALAAPDRALATELAYGCVRQRRLLQAWIDALGRRSAAQQPPKLRAILELGIYQLLFCQRVPAAAAVNTSVALAHRLGLSRLAPVVNGLLRELQRRRAAIGASAGAAATGAAATAAAADAAAATAADQTAGVSTAPQAECEPWQGLELPADPIQAFGLRHSLPDWLVERLHVWLPPERAEAFARAANAPPPLDLRINRCRTSRSAVLEAFAAAGIAAAPLPDGPDGLTLEGRPGDLRQLPGFTAGHWSVQDRSAQAIAPLLAPEPGAVLLDACAAPGGKATQLAELLADQGAVWAIDRAESRLQRLVSNAQRLGLGSVHPLAADATDLLQLRPDWRGLFQGILLDAPCSGLGTLARHADARWRVDPAGIDTLTTLQEQLLEAMVPLLAPGGRLVYATCTVHPQENQERIRAFQQAHPEFTLLQEQQSWPGEARGGDGFYAAVLQAPQGSGGGGATTGGGGGGREG